MRAARAIGAASLLALLGCTSTPEGVPAPDPTGPSASSEPTTTSTPVPTTVPEPAPEPVPTVEPPYRPDPAEVDGAVKRVAARAVEALPRVQRVTYTQYFGYLPPLASILVEADFVRGGGTTYDVRLSREDGRWRVTSMTPAEPRTAVAEPSRLVRRVLASDRIDLPWAGRVDVASGAVADDVLRSMLAVAREHRIGISVLVSAHPVNVFGTDRRSNHPDGSAYDVGRIDGRLVVDPRAAAAVRAVMRLAATTGAYQVGGPEDLDGGGSRYFSDVTHSEHVHVGFLP